MSGLNNGLVSQGGGAAATLGPGATGTTLTLSGASTALQFVSTQVSGQDAFKANTAGARWHFGPGTTDYAFSNGTDTVSFQQKVIVAAGGSSGNGLTVAGGDLSLGAGTDLVLGRSFIATFTNDSANPGNRTVNKLRGMNAVAIGAATCVITNSLVTATSSVFCVLEETDATLTQILFVTPGPGSFTVTCDVAATADVTFTWFVVN